MITMIKADRELNTRNLINEDFSKLTKISYDWSKLEIEFNTLEKAEKFIDHLDQKIRANLNRITSDAAADGYTKTEETPKPKGNLGHNLLRTNYHDRYYRDIETGKLEKEHRPYYTVMTFVEAQVLDVMLSLMEEALKELKEDNDEVFYNIFHCIQKTNMVIYTVMCK